MGVYPFRQFFAFSPQAKVLFFRNPKTASVAWAQHLQRQIPDLILSKRNSRLAREWVNSDPDLSEYFCFGFCRNPLDRFISTCGFFRWGAKRGFKCADGVFGKDMHKMHFRPQTEFLPFGEVYKFEEMEKATKDIADRLGISKDVAKVNATKAKPEITDEIKSEVLKRYKEDYERFGYKCQ